MFFKCYLHSNDIFKMTFFKKSFVNNHLSKKKIDESFVEKSFVLNIIICKQSFVDEQKNYKYSSLEMRLIELIIRLIILPIRLIILPIRLYYE